MTTSPSRECPNCLSPLQEKAGIWSCPICHFASKACPACTGEMIKQVEVPEGLGIQESGLPLEACEVVWICRNPDCGNREAAEL